MKRFLRTIALSICFVLLFSMSAMAAGNVVVTYNTPQDWVNWGAVLREFSTTTGLTAPNDNKNSGQSLTALIAEKNSPLCDLVYLGIMFGPRAVKEDVLQPYKHAYFDKIDDSLKDSSGLYSTVHFGSIAILVNTDVLGDLPIPQSWEDLLDPKYKGMIGMLDPTSAAVGYSACVAVNEAMGGSLDDFTPCIEYFKKLNQNEVVYPMQTSTAKLLKGEIPILIDADFNGYGLKYNQHGPIEVVIPKEGSVKIPYIVGIVKNCPNLENAQKLMDYLFSDAGQQLFAKGFVRPINAAALDEETKAYFLSDEDYARSVAVDWTKMSEVQVAFNERWTAEVGK